MGRFAVIVPAAGRSTRFGDPREKKTFATLEGRPVWLRAVEPFTSHARVAQVIVAIAPEDREAFDRRYGHHVAFLNLTIVDGGAERYDSIASALKAVSPACSFVAVHDAARPCVTVDLIERVFEAARLHGAAIPGLPIADTIKRVGDDGRILETVPRAGLYAVQTPQAARRDWLEDAYARPANGVTDDAQLLERAGHPCVVVEGSPVNIKITRPEDLAVASAFLHAHPGRRDRGPAHPFADERSMWETPEPPDRL